MPVNPAIPLNPSGTPTSVPSIPGEPGLDGHSLPQYLQAALQALSEPLCAAGSPLKIVVALSGGADSMALCHALWRVWRNQPTFSLRAIHINHGLHPAATQWQQQVESLCQNWQLPLETRGVQVVVQGQGLEAAARDARYQALEEMLVPGELLLTAHHQDDQAETVLLSLLRGAGLRGLAGIAEERMVGAARLIRPLLNWPGAKLKHYCQFHALSVISDPSNDNQQLRRNFLRHQVLPLLRQQWPDASAQLARSARHLRDYEHQRESEERAWLYAQNRDQQGENGSSWESLPPDLSWAELAAQPLLQQRRLLVAWLRHWLTPAVPARRLDEYLKQLNQSDQQRNPCLSWLGWQVQRYQGRLYLLSPSFLSASAPDPQVIWDWPRQRELSHAWWGSLSLLGENAAPHLAASLHLCWRYPGARLQMADGHHQTVKKLLQQSALPPWLRARVPLLFCGDELWAVADLRVSPSCRHWLQQLGLRLFWRRPDLLSLPSTFTS